MRVVVLGLVGIAIAAALGLTAHLIARDTVGLSATRLEAGTPLAPPEAQSETRAVRTTTRRTTTTTEQRRTTTGEDDDDGRGRGRGRGRGSDDSSGSDDGSGNSGRGRRDD
jgi:hypothetical protein